ncbi:hypothetical protein T492DRAFT_1046574 [Pavlovales sp. CCMP2436]|nr:hypothetical protein T492DRAFT_1046574 [Pavlovales sp. CCMP2436]
MGRSLLAVIAVVSASRLGVSALRASRACPAVPDITVAVTAHVGNALNAKLLESTLVSVGRYAPGALVLVLDTGSQWPIEQLFANITHSIERLRVHHVSSSRGQLGSLLAVDGLKPELTGLIYLQHSTALVQCAAAVLSMPSVCHQAVILGGTRAVSKPFWAQHALANALLGLLSARLNVHPPWRFDVAEHSTVYFSASAWQTVARIGLWQSNATGTPQLPEVRELLLTGKLQNRKYTMFDCGQASEMLTGFLVAWVQSTAHSLEPRRSPPLCRFNGNQYTLKVHGHSYLKKT